MTAPQPRVLGSLQDSANSNSKLNWNLKKKKWGGVSYLPSLSTKIRLCDGRGTLVPSATVGHRHVIYVPITVLRAEGTDLPELGIKQKKKKKALCESYATPSFNYPRTVNTVFHIKPTKDLLYYDDLQYFTSTKNSSYLS